MLSSIGKKQSGQRSFSTAVAAAPKAARKIPPVHLYFFAYGGAGIVGGWYVNKFFTPPEDFSVPGHKGEILLNNFQGWIPTLFGVGFQPVEVQEIDTTKFYRPSNKDGGHVTPLPGSYKGQASAEELQKQHIESYKGKHHH